MVSCFRAFYLLLALTLLAACGPDHEPASEEPVIEIFKTSFDVPSDGGYIDVRLYTDMEYHFEIIDEWISEVGKTSSNKIITHKLKVSPNTETIERTGTVTFCTDQQCIPVIIYQAADDTGDENTGNQGNGDDGDDGGNEGTPSEDNEGEWVNADFVHRSLAIRTTADWCAYCPNMGAAFDYAKNIIPDSFEILTLHGAGTYRFSATGAVFHPYPQNGYPTGVVDGRAWIVNEEPSYLPGTLAMNVAQETAANYPTVTGIAINSTLSGNDMSVTVSVYMKKAGSYKVTALVLEDGIVGYQNYHEGGVYDYEHNNVARIALSSGYGESVTADSDNQVWTKSYSATVSSSYNKDNLKILVFVEKPYGDQAKVERIYGVQYGICGDWYIDNCRAVIVGVSAPLELDDQE